ncbi:MAG: TatD family hydrolase [Anaerolineae bacterium]
MLIDTHAHLDRYPEESLGAALEEIRDIPIFTISTSMDLPSYQRNREIAEGCEWALPTCGVHPWNAPEYADRLEELRPWIEGSPMLGEIGLDFHWVEDPACYPAQRQVLEFFLRAAQEQGKIVNLHTKGAEAEILELLDRYHIRRAVVHWYSGPLDIFREMLGRGFFFTIGVEVSHSSHIQTLAREVPLAQMLTETDNPGGLKWLTGEMGMPHHLEGVIQTIADLKGSSPEMIRQTVHRNLLNLFQDDLWLPTLYVELLSGGESGDIAHP